MRSLLKWIITHPVSVILLVVVLVLVGGMSLFRIPIEIQPEQRTQQIQIVASWGGQTPESMQQTVTMPLENIAARIQDAQSVESTSGVGYARVILTFPRHVELKYAYIELQEQVALLRETLPRDVVLSIEPYSDSEEDQAQRSAFFTLELAGPMTLNRVRRIADTQVVPPLKGIDGIGDIQVFGGSNLYIRVDLRPAGIRQLGLRPVDVGQALQAFIRRQGLGTVQQDGTRYLLLFTDQPARVQDIAAIPLLTHPAWHIGDVATVSIDYAQPTSLSRHNYQPLVSIHLYKTAGANALRFSQDVHHLIATLRTRLPAGMHLRVVTDQADNLRQELNSLGTRAAVILLIVFGLLLVLFRQAFLSGIILSIVLLSLLCASILLYASGYTINVVTLAGIALVFGMLVDNAVVVTENIHRHQRAGDDLQTSGVQGTLEMVQPMIAATLTTVVVFFSLLLLRQRLGDYYRPLAFALGFSLLASLLLAVTLIPAMYLQLQRHRGSRRRSRTTQAVPTGLRTGYERFIRWNLRHRGVVYLLLLVLAGLATDLFVNRVPRGAFYQYRQSDILRVSIGAPRGVTLHTLDDIAAGFEQRIRSSGIPCDVQTTVSAPNANGHLRVTFPDSTLQTLGPAYLKEQLGAQAVNYAGVGIFISGFGDPFNNGGYRLTANYNTYLDITGPRYDRMWELGRSILAMARQSPRVAAGVVVPSRRNLWQSDLKAVTLEAPIASLWQQGWTRQAFLNQIRLWFYRRVPQGEIALGNERLPLQVTLGTEVPSLRSVQNAVLQTPAGGRFRAGSILQTHQAPLPLWIDKQNQQYRFTIAWEYRGPPRMMERYQKQIVDHLALPDGYNLVPQAYGFLTAEEQSDLLRLILLVVGGTYLILAALYESFRRPLVIFLSVPFALTGIFLTYVLFGRSFDVNSYIGVILLTGLVVNNAIILVDRIAQLHKAGVPLQEAVVQGTVQRIRPILITTLTTIGGLIPILFLGTKGAFVSGIMEELSFITIAGMTSSTLLTITVIPLIYYSVEKFRYRWRHL